MPQVGERLGRYEVEKRCAVEKEDYDLAKEKKQQMARYRAQVYEQLELHGLLQGEPEVRVGCGGWGMIVQNVECGFLCAAGGILQ